MDRVIILAVIAILLVLVVHIAIAYSIGWILVHYGMPNLVGLGAGIFYLSLVGFYYNKNND